MVLTIQSSSNNKARINVDRKLKFKTFFYIIILVISLFTLDLVFGWKTVEEIPSFLQPYNKIILWFNPYLIYVQAGLLFIFGYLSINVVSSLIYMHFLRIADHPTAAAIRSIFKISGIAVLLSIVASIFNVNPAAALTVGSFGGLVVGFATQTILSHVVAGVFLLITRPFILGDLITVSGHTGLVKEVKLMHIVLESEDGENYILIPSGSVVTQIIKKRKSTSKQKPIETVLTLDPLQGNVLEGSKMEFTGKLVEHDTGDPIPGVDIMMCECDLGVDDLIVSGKTGNDGRFNVMWKAVKMDWGDRTAEIYAKFQGNANYGESKSDVYKIKLRGNKIQ